MPEPRPTQRQEASRWACVLARREGSGETFVYSVATTGVYCRPTCGSRRPLRRNVRFHDSPQHAEHEGFRPCLRCRPNGPTRTEDDAALVERICRLLDSEMDTPPSLSQLAQSSGRSASNLQRLFRRVTGLSPKEWTAARRAQRLRHALPRSTSVTHAFYEAGFGSSGRFYEQANAMLGMSPRAFRKGGEGESMQYAIVPCSLGKALIATTCRGVCAILLGDEDPPLLQELESRFPLAMRTQGDTALVSSLKAVVRWVDSDAGKRFPLPVDLLGTAFQQRVWHALQEIPAGQTLSYGELAQKLGDKKATRAVAGACGKNHVAIAVPCHRVIGSDGALTGYRWGLDRKHALLRREGAEKVTGVIKQNKRKNRP